MGKWVIRDQLFKINDVVSLRFVKFSNVNITNTLVTCYFFSAVQKILTSFPQKITVY